MVTITLLGYVALFAVAISLCQVFINMCSELLHKWIFYPITIIGFILILGLVFDLKLYYPFKIMFLYVGISLILLSLIGIIFVALVGKMERRWLDRIFTIEINKKN